MNNILKKFKLNNINILSCGVVLSVLILTYIILCYEISILPKKYSVNENEIIQELGKVVVREINNYKGIYIIEVIVEKDEDINKEWNTFVSGKGIAEYINYSIILKNNENDNSYELKTKLYENQEDKLVFRGNIKQKYVSQKSYSIGVCERNYIVDRKQLYNELYFSDKQYDL